MPSESFDPVEVAALSPEVLGENVAEALAAFDAATDLDQLKTARLAHTGDRSPVALANREIGALPPAARSAAGQRVGAARKQLGEVLYFFLTNKPTAVDVFPIFFVNLSEINSLFCAVPNVK